MKIIINATNITEDRPLREVERLINLGLAHLPEVKPIPVKTYNGYVQSEKPEITFEDLDNIEMGGFLVDETLTAEILKDAPLREVAIDIDPIEPIPVDRYVSFDEPKKTKKKLFHR